MPNTAPLAKTPRRRLNRVRQPDSAPEPLPPHYVEHLRRIGVPEPQWKHFVSDLRAIVCSVLDAECPPCRQPNDP